MVYIMNQSFICLELERNTSMYEDLSIKYFRSKNDPFMCMGEICRHINLQNHVRCKVTKEKL
jgi:hypothetical protein